MIFLLLLKKLNPRARLISGVIVTALGLAAIAVSAVIPDLLVHGIITAIIGAVLWAHAVVSNRRTRADQLTHAGDRTTKLFPMPGEAKPGWHNGRRDERPVPMTPPAKGGPLRWPYEIVRGLYRSAVLVALTALIPVVVVFIGFGGTRIEFSWGALLVAVRVAAAVWITHLLTSRRLAKAARRLAKRWLGVRIEVSYSEVSPVTRMATGHWWDGREYHKSEREARRRARMNARFHDPQLRWDGVWAVVAGVTVFPIAALPLLALAGGVYLTLAPGLLGYGVAMIAVGLAIAPFAWRVFGPLAVRLLGPVPFSRLGRRVAELEAVRADLTQTQAAELERIERGLHDGAQARMVALGMSMQAAERLVDADPDAAKALLAEARVSSIAALEELRSLVRGINPPVLAERGLVDAVRALALDASVEVAVRSDVPARPERPVESAIYFAVAELLANVAKHAHANQVTVELVHKAQTLTATVTDDGIGGAASYPGSGLSGIERRMTAFGGRLAIDSPAGGPTRVTVEAPCALS